MNIELTHEEVKAILSAIQIAVRESLDTEQMIEALFTLSMNQAKEINDLRNLLSKTVNTMDKLTDSLLNMSQQTVSVVTTMDKVLDYVQNLNKHE